MRHAIGIGNGNWRSGDLAQFSRSYSELSKREVALSEIKEIMGSERFVLWYNDVYELRRSGDQVGYEKKIFEKLEKLNDTLSDISGAKLCTRFGQPL